MLFVILQVIDVYYLIFILTDNLYKVKNSIMSDKVLNVIVTYNRLDDLKVCVHNVKAQTYRDIDILVVNNGSTDGTTEFLAEQKDIKVINQDNLGGAGGFYAGMKFMIDNGYDWLWMMDDDGIPDSKQLETMISFYKKTGFVFLNALVIDKDDHSKLAFGPLNGDKYTYVNEVTQDEDFDVMIYPFNGTLIKREVIEKIGLIKKDCFIWGDEHEYSLRAKHFGYSLHTVTTAIHYHPTLKAHRGRVFPGLSHKNVLVQPKHFSHYFYRNQGYIDHTYNDYHHIFTKFIIRNSVYFIRTGQFKELCKLFKYYIRGWHNNYENS